MKKTYLYFLLIAITLGFMSCNDFLEEKPTTQIDRKDVFNDATTALGALSGCYASMTSYDSYSYRYYHVLTATSGLGVSIKTNDLTLTTMAILANDANVESIYDAQYATIRDANDILDGMATSTIKDEKMVARIIGEASFIRAVSYFNLVRLFGKLSLHTEPVKNFGESHKPRVAVDEIYKQIIVDLTEAQLNLPSFEDRITGRPHKYAAEAMLAKVYLTMAGNDETSSYWQKSYDLAKGVYDAAVYQLIPSFSNVLGANNKNNSESIFEIQFAALQGGSRLTEMTFPLGHPLLPNAVGGNSWGKTRPTKSAFDMFDPNDPRRDVTFAHTKYTNILEPAANKKNIVLYPSNRGGGLAYKQGDSEYAAYIKFTDPTFTTVSNCNFVYYRYADLLLVLAEAANELGLKQEAVGYLNEVLDRARDKNGNGTIDPSTEIYPLAVDESTETKETLRKVVMKERLLELAGEADEWYTLRRRGSDYLKEVIIEHNRRINELFPTGELPRFVYNISESDNDIKRNLLLPFPANEIGRNSSISPDEQNFGY